MTFVDAINRIFRMNGIIRGDTDAIVNFQGSQHAATVQVAIIAVQDSINDLVGDQIIPKERASGTVTLVDSVATSVRTYTLAADFAKFWQEQTFFYDPVNNNEIFEYAGGEKQLQLDVFDYAIPDRQHGYPNWWYWVDASTATVAFFQNPDSTVAGRTLTYDYQKTLMPTAYTDVLPFQQETQAMAFVEMASARFEAMMTSGRTGSGTMINADVRRMPAYVAAMAKTMNLINPKARSRKYGNQYISRFPSP